jgi:hypothetical protein
MREEFTISQLANIHAQLFYSVEKSEGHENEAI